MFAIAGAVFAALFTHSMHIGPGPEWAFPTAVGFFGTALAILFDFASLDRLK